MKRLLAAFVLLGFVVVLLTACDRASGSAAGPNQVHMDDTKFQQSSITIKKGESITLVNDAISVHIISNGTWVDSSTPKDEKEAGAPTISNVQIDGYASKTFGPFNTAGTFQLYCTVHNNMNLTVVVQ